MRRALVIAVAACAATLTAPGVAAAAKPACAVAVLKDWADGKLDRQYPVRCYQDALNRMPEDMRSYTTAPDDIQRALLARLRSARTHHGAFRGTSARSPNGKARVAPAATRRPKPTARKQGPVREALATAGTVGARSTGIPLPLVVLGAIGLLLIMGGSAGALGRRFRTQPARHSRP
jgi:hypothetical protein